MANAKVASGFRIGWKTEPQTGLPLPEINQSLSGQYIFDPDLEIECQEKPGAYRFPGDVVERTTDVGEPYQSALIPILDGASEREYVSSCDRSFLISGSNLAKA